MKFRKKPVVIDAMQYLREENIVDVQDFVGKYLKYDPDTNEYQVETLEGTSYFLTKFDWIIKGVNGEFYPCKPDIFEKTYELASTPQPVKEDGWIAVEDGLPEIEESVIVVTAFIDRGKPMTDTLTGYMDEYGELYYLGQQDESYGWQFNDCVTHWMPLPQPPISKQVKI